jgi:hypothetical protein
VGPAEVRDWLPLLDREVSRLPEKYRAAVVLCDLEGRTRREAARQLAIPEGTLSSRLTTARRLLARRLTARGVTLTAGALAVALPAALVVAGIALAAGLTYGFVHQHDQNQQRAEDQIKATVMRRFSNELDPVLSSTGQAVPPGNSFKAFSDLASAVSGLDDGSVQPDAAATTATQAASTAKAAASAIAKIDAVGIVGGKTNDPTFVQYVISAKDELVGAMHQYGQVAALVVDASKVPDDVRPLLVARAKALISIAAASLNRGYDWYVQAESIAGTFQPTALGPSGAPGIRPTGTTGGLTGATAGTGATGLSGASGSTGASGTKGKGTSTTGTTGKGNG